LTLHTEGVYDETTMYTQQTAVRKRVNIMLSQDTLHLIKRVVKQGDRSRLIDKAVHFYIGEMGRKNLRDELRAGARARAARDSQIADEWFSLENEVWQTEKSK